MTWRTTLRHEYRREALEKRLREELAAKIESVLVNDAFANCKDVDKDELFALVGLVALDACRTIAKRFLEPEGKLTEKTEKK